MTMFLFLLEIPYQMNLDKDWGQPISNVHVSFPAIDSWKYPVAKWTDILFLYGQPHSELDANGLCSDWI